MVIFKPKNVQVKEETSTIDVDLTNKIQEVAPIQKPQVIQEA